MTSDFRAVSVVQLLTYLLTYLLHVAVKSVILVYT